MSTAAAAHIRRGIMFARLGLYREAMALPMDDCGRLTFDAYLHTIRTITGKRGTSQ